MSQEGPLSLLASQLPPLPEEVPDAFGGPLPRLPLAHPGPENYHHVGYALTHRRRRTRHRGDQAPAIQAVLDPPGRPPDDPLSGPTLLGPLAEPAPAALPVQDYMDIQWEVTYGSPHHGE